MSKVEKHIRRAMKEGQFDDLPGKGKPLPLNENPHENPEWRMANHLLRTSGFTLPWIETYREIKTDLEAERNALARTWAWRQACLQAEETFVDIDMAWRQAVETFHEQIADLNRRLFSYNMGVPTEHFQKPLLKADREISRLTTSTLSDTL